MLELDVGITWGEFMSVESCVVCVGVGDVETMEMHRRWRPVDAVGGMSRGKIR